MIFGSATGLLAYVQYLMYRPKQGNGVQIYESIENIRLSRIDGTREMKQPAYPYYSKTYINLLFW